MTTIHENDSTGREIRTYRLSTQQDGANKSEKTTRMDVVFTQEAQVSKPSLKSSYSAASILTLPFTILADYFLPLFLPHGYPHTVTPDYTPYQIYDSFQAFASTIAGLLSSRAVLQSLGFDDDKSSSVSTATFATLLSIAQATVSNLSTILFAHYASQRISSEVKFYRFLADIVNDTAFLIDCLSPSLPRSLRVPALCCSSLFRAVCGVAGGSSKAVLSAHFAINGNVGELNAKDSSQETVIGLMGMWIGGLVVSHVSGVWATWSWMLVLLALHLWLNYQAVRCVRLRGLNGYRAGIVLSELSKSGRCPGIEEVGRNEGIFDRSDVLLGTSNQRLGHVKVGVSVTQFISALGAIKVVSTGAWIAKHDSFQRCIQTMSKENYLLWFDVQTRRAFILLKEGATIDDELKAWYHAIRLGSTVSGSLHLACERMVEIVSETLKESSAEWPSHRSMMTATGWDLSRSSTEIRPGPRMRVS